MSGFIADQRHSFRLSRWIVFFNSEYAAGYMEMYCNCACFFNIPILSSAQHTHKIYLSADICNVSVVCW